MAHSASVLQRLSALSLGAVLTFGPAFVSAAQQQPRRPQLPGTNEPDPANVWQEKQRKQMEKKANLQRQDEIKKDTEKLLELATELKQSVDKTTENTLSLDVVKKAEQIEKLAKAVREKMKGP